MSARAHETLISRNLDGPALAADIVELDAADRRGASIHLALGMLWMISLSLGRAADSIAFAALVVIAVARLPRSARLVRARLRASWPLALGSALGLLVWISGAWSDLSLGDAMAPPRWLLVPLLLLPIARHWQLLLGAYVAGAMLQGCWILLEAAFVFGRVRYGDPLGLADNPLTFLGLLGTGALIAGASMLAPVRSRTVRIAAGFALFASTAGLFCLANRTALLGTLAGFATLAVVGVVSRTVPLARAAALAAIIVAASLTAGGTAFDRLFPTEAARERAIARGERPTGPTDGDPTELDDAQATPAAEGRSIDGVLATYTSHRWTIWRLTAPAVRAHPLLGHGRNGWHPVWKATMEKSADRRQFRGMRMLNTAHNAYLQAAVDQGLVGLLLLVGTLSAVAALAWHERVTPRGLLLAGLLASWAVGAMSSSSLNISSGWVPFALMIWLASWHGKVDARR